MAVLFVLYVALILALGGGPVAPAAEVPQTRTPAPPKPSSKPTAPAPRKPALTDAELENDIRARFQKSKISVENFQVRVQGGIATILGKTAIVQRKGTATRLARLAGARAVVNRIEVSEAAKRKAAENLAEGRRRAQVKRSERF